VLAASLLGVATPSAVADTSALGLGCFVDTWQIDVVQADQCFAGEPALQYTVQFEVLGRSAGGYTYNWDTTGSTVAGGCASSSYYCFITVRPNGHPWSRTVSAVVTEAATGASKVVTAVAEGEPVCGAWEQLYFC